jgi:CRP-like cAMP-binding protein
LGYHTVVSVTGPIVEEILKAAILIYLVRHPRFRYIVDGAAYGIAVGIGFATSENYFFYLPDAGSAVLGVAISRVLSTALMHATASSLVGISLGRLRRSRDTSKIGWPVLGIGLAITLHVVFNNVVSKLEGVSLLLIAIGFGIGGSLMIGFLISQGLKEEKKRFAETLGLSVGVSTGERKAVQRVGGAPIEQIFGELDDFFGKSSISQIRRLLALQANVGILKNNLSNPVSERLRKAWEDEIDELRAEIDKLRGELGGTVNLFLQSVFPSDDLALQDALTEEMGQYDPTLVHTFDMFMRVSELAETFTPEQLAAMAERLSTIGIFKNVSLANLENLSRAIVVQTFEEGQLLFDKGDQGDAMYLIEQGSVNISTTDHEGKEKLLRVYQGGDVVGEFSLLDGQPRSARGRAASKLSAFVLQREVFMRFIQSRPQVILAMLQYLADKARYTTQAVETSIAWIGQITAGHYQAPEAVPESTPAAAAQPTEAPVFEPADVSAETPALVGEVFSKAAATLEKRGLTTRSQPAAGTH